MTAARISASGWTLPIRSSTRKLSGPIGRTVSPQRRRRGGGAAVIDLLDKALETLLAQELPSVHVYFDAPDDKFGPTLPAIDLFLYDIRENRELRSNEWIMQRTNGQVTKQR